MNFGTNFGRHLVGVHRNEKDACEYMNVKAYNLKGRKMKHSAIFLINLERKQL